MNRDGVATSVCCKLDGKAFRFYLEESFNIFTKHSEDGQYLVKNYQSMVLLSLMTWWILVCTKIVEPEQAIALSHTALNSCLTALEKHQAQDAFVKENIFCAFLTVFISNHPLSEFPRSNKKLQRNLNL